MSSDPLWQPHAEFDNELTPIFDAVRARLRADLCDRVAAAEAAEAMGRPEDPFTLADTGWPA